MGKKLFTSLFERVMARVAEPENEQACWFYRGARCHKGYGSVTVRVPGKKNPTRARTHLVVYEAVHGPDWRERAAQTLGCTAADVTLDHLCQRDNRESVAHCCNPDHLEPVTRVTNSARMQARRKSLTDS